MRADLGLPAAEGSAPAGSAVRDDGQVADLAGVAGRALEWPPTDDEPASDADLAVDVQHVVDPDGSAAAMLGKHAEIGLVGDDDGHVQVEARGEPASEWHARPAQVRGRLDKAVAAADDAGDGDADAGQPVEVGAAVRQRVEHAGKVIDDLVDGAVRPRPIHAPQAEDVPAEADHCRREGVDAQGERDSDASLGHETDLGRGTAGTAEMDVTILGRQARCHELADQVADGAAREARAGDEVGARLGSIVMQAANDRAQVRAPHALAPLAEVEPWWYAPSLCSPLSNLCETEPRARRCQVAGRGWTRRQDAERLEAGMDKVRWGVLSTARIATEKVIPGIRRSARGEVVAIASRDGDRARAAAGRARDPAQPRLVRGAAGRSGGGRGLHPAAQPPPCGVVDQGPAGRQARPVREAARADGGRCGPRWRTRRRRRAGS